MRCFRAVPRINDASIIRRTVLQSSRQLSIALLRQSTPHSSPITNIRSQKFPPSALQPLIRYASSSTQPEESLKKTPLYNLHVAQGAKMVPFGGYYMPVQYSDQSVSQSHHFTRSHASLFDVSHMVQHNFTGPGAMAFLEKITPADITGLGMDRSTLSTLLWPTGGIVDDCIITRIGPETFYVVTNAACAEKDAKYLSEELKKFLETSAERLVWEKFDGEKALIALQGPLSEDILSSLLARPEEVNLKDMHFGQFKVISFKFSGGEHELSVSRGGYTGEDGFEISMPEQLAEAFTKVLLQTAGPEKLRLAGLGARDSLRLEAGMCLYGHDLDDTTTPVEAGLSWVIGQSRKTGGGFYGSDIILPQLTPKSKGGTGVERRRVGFLVEGAPAREGTEIFSISDGAKIGNITSGCPSPTLGKNIAMGYIKQGFNKSGTDVEVVVRGKKRKAQVTKMPFVPTNYWKGAAPA